MQGSPRERREIILAYIDRARRRADAAEGGKDHSVEPEFLWRPPGKASERREGILEYAEQARRGLDEAGTQKDGSEIR